MSRENLQGDICPHIPTEDRVGDERDWCMSCLRNDNKKLRAKLSRQTKAQAKLNKAALAWLETNIYLQYERYCPAEHWPLVRAIRTFERVTK